MHEMALLRNVVDIVLDECSGKDVAAVRSVYLTVGELRDVVEDIVPGLFKWLARDTVAADADVFIRRVPAMVRCNQCGDIFKINVRDPKTWECPRCHAYQDYRLFSGNEFRIERIEVERKGAPGDQGAAAATGEGQGSAADQAAAPAAEAAAPQESAPVA